MRIVTLEEHVTFPEQVKLLPERAAPLNTIDNLPMIRRHAVNLADIDDGRLDSMNRNGISCQVISVAGPGAEVLDLEAGPAFARKYNDLIAARIRKHPDRFAAFAHLPITSPLAAADELERTVSEYGFKGALINGMTDGLFLDDPVFAPLLKRAEYLGVPLYIHPGIPPEAVFGAYYDRLPQNAGPVMAISGWGWHSETAIHILRLVVSGTLDKYPRLQIIIGHMGEMLPMMMLRFDNKFKIGAVGCHARPVSQTLMEQVYLTTSGVFDHHALTLAISAFGIDKILFSVDYPFSTNEEGVSFLEKISLPREAIEKIAFRNADALLKMKP